jgi:peptide/nickel transport system substrate-binding protein
MKKKFLYMTLVLLVVALTVISCNGNTPAASTTQSTSTSKTTSPTTTTTTVASPKYGGEMVLVSNFSPGSPIGWPAEARGETSMNNQLCMETLLHENLDGSIIPWLAKSYVIADDKSSITFQLQEGVKFHDGTDFNADAVKFNYDALLESGSSVGQYWDTVEVLSTYSVRVKLKAWTNFTIRLFVGAPNIISPTAYREKGLDYVRWNPVGTGPFVFESYQTGDSFKVKRFDNYWQKGKPYLDAVTIRYVSDETTQVTMMQAGEIDALKCELGTVAANLLSLGFTVKTQVQGATFLMPDAVSADSYFKDEKVRQALAYGIDVVTLAAMGEGMWKPVYQVAPRDNAAYDPNFKPLYTHDVAKAKQLLAEAGHPAGFECTLTIAPFGITRDVAAVVQSQLAEIGITTTLEFPDFSRFSELQSSGWTGILLNTVPTVANICGTMYETFLSSITNYSVLRSEKFMSLLDVAIHTKTIDLPKIRAAMKQLLIESAIVPVHETGMCWALSKDVRGGGFLTQGFPTYFNMEDAWFDR